MVDVSKWAKSSVLRLVVGETARQQGKYFSGLYIVGEQ